MVRARCPRFQGAGTNCTGVFCMKVWPFSPSIFLGGRASTVIIAPLLPFLVGVAFLRLCPQSVREASHPFAVAPPNVLGSLPIVFDYIAEALPLTSAHRLRRAASVQGRIGQ